MLTANGLTCVRGDRPLFSSLDLAVDAGEWLHVRGANGSGKTSLLRLLCGLAVPEQGEILWNGIPIRRMGSEWRRNLLFSGHQAGVKEDLTALENLQLAGALDDCRPPAQEVIVALRRLGLKGREGLAVRHLSAGQKRRVLLARLLTRKAKLWILDEPFTALDTRAVETLSQLVGEHLQAGGLAVITSHQQVPLAAGRVLEL